MTRLHTAKKILTAGCIAAAFSLTANATQIHDAVEYNGGWIVINGGGFAPSKNGLDPVEGDYLWSYGTSSTANQTRGTWKLFTETFQAETLKVTYSVGEWSIEGWNWTGAISPLLFADTDGNYEFNWSERIIPGTQNHTEPTDGWEQWEDVYSITAETMTVGGHPVIGERIGFFILSPVNSYENFAFDSLSIETITATAALDFIIIN